MVNNTFSEPTPFMVNAPLWSVLVAILFRPPGRSTRTVASIRGPAPLMTTVPLRLAACPLCASIAVKSRLVTLLPNEVFLVGLAGLQPGFDGWARFVADLIRKLP